MNRKKYGFVVCLLLLIAVASLAAVGIYAKQNDPGASGKKLKVVTSFYPIYIAAWNVVDGCEAVTLENLSEPQTGCLHDYQLTPEDMRLLSGADVFIVNGGGMEGFLTDVAKQYPGLAILEAGAGASMLGENAHLWMDLENYQKEVRAIAEGLAKEADPRDGELFLENAKEYCDQIQSLASSYAGLLGTSGEKTVLLHEACEYFAKEWGLEDVYTLNLDEERQVSAGEMKDLLRVMDENGVKLVLAERRYGEETAKSIQKENGATVLYLDIGVRGAYEKDAYLDAMGENLELLENYLENSN